MNTGFRSKLFCLQTKKNLNQNRKYNSHAENECRCCLTAIRYNTAKIRRSVTNIATLQKFLQAKRFSPELFQQCCLSAYFKENVTQMTISQTDSPNFKWQFLQLKKKLTAIMQISFFLVILISIIIDTWQIWKIFHLIRIITTQHLD